MAMRLQKDTTVSEDGPQSPRNTTLPSVDNRSIASVVEEEEGIPLSITPSTDVTKTAMVRQFDRGDVIPFFFTMPHGNTSTHDDDAATELANCMERMLQRERTGVFEPPPGKTALLILDDLHVAIPSKHERSKALYPSVYAYLRSVQEHKTVYRGANSLPISVENLMMLATMHCDHFMNNSRDESLRKLTTQLFPVLAPSCELQELHNIFGQALQTHWGVSTSPKTGTGTISSAVRHAIPLVIAATTVLWDRLRATYKYRLQDLARVYEGLSCVGTSLLADVETLLRLWTHENCRSLREPSMGLCSTQQDGDVTGEIAQMRSLVSQVTQRRASARASRLSISTGSLSFAPKRQSVVHQPVNDEISSPAALLALFAARTSGSTGKTLYRSSQQFNSLQEQQHRAVMVGGLWAFVPSSVGRWIYAEISFEEDTEAVSTTTMQAYFRDLRTFSSTTMTLHPSSSKKTTALPQNVPPVPFKLVRIENFEVSCTLLTVSFRPYL
ncbi:hypothetical protein PHMEG_00017173 [Phytophthora megakarya]|uniref:Dynein heavy chain n=1 Tax=Phytophthora megakarya TaxID=4795 RepID=A0A225VYQ6_9STRA|nr:hypothetical protein PHMEG_00017173 [Phytophthora megakarya]